MSLAQIVEKGGPFGRLFLLEESFKDLFSPQQ